LEKIKLLSIGVYGFLRCKVLEFRITSIEERIDKLHNLSLFFQLRFDKDRSDKINNKIEYLSKRKVALTAFFNDMEVDFLKNLELDLR
jgi:hypothetical protein